jgi:hypothetical protein
MRYPDGTLVYTPKTTWVGEVLDQHLHFIGYLAATPDLAHVNTMIGLAHDIIVSWKDERTAELGEVIIALPDTPEWDQLNALLMKWMLETKEKPNEI